MSGKGSSTESAESDDPVVVYRTALLHEADVVAEALSRARIPYFRRLETIGGLSTIVPVNPPPGLMPGSFFAIAVPGQWVGRAERFIGSLPVSQEIGASHEMPGVKEMFKGWTWIFVAAILLALIWGVIRMYMAN